MGIRIFFVGFGFILFGFSLFLSGADWRARAGNLSRQEMQSVIEFLSDDLLEGRAPGTPGGQLAEIYLRSLFKWMDLPPSGSGNYLQPFALKGFTGREIVVQAANMELTGPEDIVGGYTLEEDTFSLEGEVVFVGFGISTSLWNWDDIKGEDMRNKVLLVRVNGPGHFLPDAFEGRSMTYFGRWRYKIEEAVRLGAKAILLIHTDDTAGYDWKVVRNSWAKENLYLPASLSSGVASSLGQSSGGAGSAENRDYPLSSSLVRSKIIGTLTTRQL